MICERIHDSLAGSEAFRSIGAAHKDKIPSRLEHRRGAAFRHLQPYDCNTINCVYNYIGCPDFMREPASASLRQIFGRRLCHTARRWRRAVDRRLQPFGLTEASWLPLVHIARAIVPIRQKDLAELLSLEGSTVVRLVDGLVEAGLVERRIEDDRRARFLHLTEAGFARLKQVNAATAAVRRQAIAGIDDDELAQALDVIDRVCAALDRMDTLAPNEKA